MKLPAPTRRQRRAQTVLPAHVYHALRFEIAMATVRLRAPVNRRAYRASENLRVNVGAGANGRDGWVNLDAFPGPGVTSRHDCRWSLPFPDKSVEMLFSEHFLEHLERSVEVPRFLDEVHRVLKPRGVVRLIVPDVELYLRAYCARDWDTLSRIRPLHGRRDRWFDVEYETPLEMAQFVMRQLPAEPHQYGYDAETLTLALSESGFTDIQRRDFGESGLDGLALDLPERASESLYLEATRSANGYRGHVVPAGVAMT